MNYRIRPASPKDSKELMTLAEMLALEIKPGFYNPEVNFRSEYLNGFKKIFFQENHYVAFLAEKKNILGFSLGYPYGSDPLDISISSSNDIFYLAQTYVKKSFRNNGIAQSLCNEMADYAKEQGFSEIFCSINKYNIASINVAKKTGFEIETYDDKDICISFRKILR